MVDTTERFRAARTVPVPTELDDSGWAYFPAHFRIARGGGVAPRLRYSTTLVTAPAGCISATSART